MNVFIINHSVENCGVYQYGKRFASILKKSTNINFIYLELNNHEELDKNIEEYKPEFIIYNYLGGTMPWVTEQTVDKIRQTGIKQLLIVHNVGYATFFDYYLHQNPYHPDVDDRNFAIARPLLDYKSNIQRQETDVIKIGSFGFGFKVKYFDDICRIVSNQLHDKKVEINLHLTNSHFCPNANDIQSIKNDCLSILTNPNHKLNMTNDFISDNEMLEFLDRNDLNIFFYAKYGSYNGISSTIDYALSVKRPLAICRSNMFSHIYDVSPSICVEENSLISIMENGFKPLEEKYNSWTNEKFIHIIENVIEKIK